MTASIRSELMKCMSTLAFKVVALIMIPVQAALAYVSAKQVLSIGLDAVPDGTNQLIEAMPPPEYFGFDVVLMSLIPLIILGALLGAMEYKRHCMRTTLVYMGSRRKVYVSKTVAVAIMSFALSLLSVFFTILITHLTFGDQGLTPVLFNLKVWSFIMWTTVSFTCVTVLSYAMGFLLRSAVIPMIFLVVQAYNVGELLAQKFTVFRFFPIALSNSLVPSSVDSFSETPGVTLLILFVWIAVFAVAGYVVFERRDLTGEY